MKISQQNADEVVLRELGARLARSRLDRNLSQAQLAHEAGIGKRTVERIEAGDSAQLASLIRILRALDMVEGFDALIPEPIASPLEQLALRGRERRRASSRTHVSGSDRDWTWGDET
jgi:transcriptional regulator with XRE-family HTH domain